MLIEVAVFEALVSVNIFSSVLPLVCWLKQKANISALLLMTGNSIHCNSWLLLPCLNYISTEILFTVCKWSSQSAIKIIIETQYTYAFSGILTIQFPLEDKNKTFCFWSAWQWEPLKDTMGESMV